MFEEVTRPFRFVQTDLKGRHELMDGYSHAVVMTYIQTKLTKLLMTSNRSVESLTYAINALIAKTGSPEVIHSDREYSVILIAKANNLENSLFKKYRIDFRSCFSREKDASNS